MTSFLQSIYQLIVDTSTNLPRDVRHAIQKARARESASTRSRLSLDTIASNMMMAEQRVSPICQDTGMPTFLIRAPIGANQLVMRQHICEAINRATTEGKLRTNSVDSLTGHNSGNNVGPGTPVIHFTQWERDEIEVKLLLKGGGCENKNIQYSLPIELEGLGEAGRNLDGIRKCILHAVYQAQGQGCSAGFIGVGVGGDRTTGYELAKHQLFRKVDDCNRHPDLNRLETYIMDKANELGIGTMGFGGEVTLLGCKIGIMNRLPASFFVSVAYNCWAFRRQGVRIDRHSGAICDWLYERGTTSCQPASMEQLQIEQVAATTERGVTPQVVLTPPLCEQDIRLLRVGDVVVINGEIHTGRDALHKHLLDHDAPIDLQGAVIYHCGPVMLQSETEWQVKAAGPTTSIREEPYQDDIIKKFGIRAIIGKGGMGAKTLASLQEHGCVYLNAIGGAAQYYATCIKRVKGVDYIEFGIPEAMWHLEVEGFTAIVTMDAQGNSLHAEVDRSSLEKLSQFKESVF